ncbi:carbonic anhydrase family protein [Thiomicrorhabdus sp.]|uniref:carbonic anhydrase family protein n=1 Tax=Thiomicrorhabdus sp. TaxID=2039724 RepID=UPI0029C5FFF3|nr:carbonic anhydrase family protein [Thiomicrorhabdus sp.]
MSLRSLSVFMFLTAVFLPSQSVSADDLGQPLVDLQAEIERLKQGENGALPGNATGGATASESPGTSVPALEVKRLNVPKQPKKVSKPRVVKSVKAIPSAQDRWSYAGASGPANWGHLSEAFGLCSQGKNQSPIDLRAEAAIGSQNLPPLNLHYPPLNMQLEKGRRGIVLETAPGAVMSLGNQHFALQKIALHTPSEHSLQGKIYPLELQFWHQSDSARFLAAAVLVAVGDYNANLDAVISLLEKKDATLLQNLPAGLIKPLDWLPGVTEYYRYNGSMTTPPCSEGVSWVVFKQPLQASVEQIARLQALQQDNARPRQELNARLPVRSWLQGETSSLPYEFY